VSSLCVAKDFGRLPDHVLVTLKWKHSARGLLEVLSDCKALAHLDLHEGRLGDEGAGELAWARGECKALTHLALTENNIGAAAVGHVARALEGCQALAHLNRMVQRERVFWRGRLESARRWPILT